MFMLFRKHFKSIFLILSIALITGCFGLSQKESGVDKDYLAKQAKTEKAKQEIKVNLDKVTDKGKALVHGAGYAINLETNKTPPVQVAGELISHAQLTLGNPSLADSKKIEDIVDGLVQEVKAENLKLKIQNTTNKLELDILKTELKKADSEGKAARQKLNAFEEQITKLQNNEDLLKKKYEGELDKLNKENLDNAEKAKNWDAEHGFWQQFNIFSDIVSLIKKLFTLSIICGVCVVLFKILEIFMPGLNIISSFFGVIVKCISKLFPAAKSAAGLVSSKVYDAFSHLVKANENIFEKLEKAPLEEEIVNLFPDDKMFTKSEVKTLLFQLTDKTIDLFKAELNKHTDENSKALVRYAKADAGITNEKISPEI